MPLRYLFSLCLFFSVLLAAGCGKDKAGGNGNADAGTGDASGECIDNDGDGLGVNCPRGEDCDDTNILKGANEVCDNVDNDCDGSTDETLLAICEECTPSCSAQTISGENGWGLDEDNSSGNVLDENGALTLGVTQQPSGAVWIANTGEGTVSKFDAASGKELARYPSVINDTIAQPWNNSCTENPSTNTGNCPSRTAVDQEYNAYVANRAFAHQGTVTKYADKEEDCRCTGPAADGKSCTVVTSRDVNEDGAININDSSEFPGLNDDCILWTVAVGGSGDIPRAIAVGKREADAAAGTVWVGLNNTTAQKVVALKPEDGSPDDTDPSAGVDTSETSTGNHRPYGLATDKAGRVWIVNRRGGDSACDALGYIEPWTIDGNGRKFQKVTPVPIDNCIGASDPFDTCMMGQECFRPYGLAIDAEGAVYVSNSEAPAHIWRYQPDPGNPATGTWAPFTAQNMSGGTLADAGYTRGIGTDETNLWLAVTSSDPSAVDPYTNKLLQFRLRDGDTEMYHYKTYDTGTMANPDYGLGPVGVGVAADHSVWLISKQDSIASRLECSNVACDCENTGDCTWTYRATGSKPYTYSDFTGFSINVLADPGNYRFIVASCEEGNAKWQGISYTDTSTAPAGSVKFQVRTANTIEAFAAMGDEDNWVGLFEGNPVSLLQSPGPLNNSKYLQVEVQLFPIDPQNPPRITEFQVASDCLGDGQV